MRPILTAAAVALGLAAAADAQVTSAHLAALDTSGDGKVDAAEFDAFVATSFKTVDANGDGYITEAEAAGHMAPELWRGANSNGDDGVSSDEFAAQADADFAAADRDGDGTLD